MKRHRKNLATAVAIGLMTAMLGGCGGGPGPESASLGAPLAKSHARVKIHRQSNLMGMALDVRVKVDGREVASLGNDETRSFDIPAGARQITVDHWAHPGASKIDLQAKPGVLYELEVAVRGEAAVAGMAFGIVGTVAESAASGDAGYWSLHLAKQSPAA